MEGRIKMLAGRHMRALQCIDDVMMHCADGAICADEKLYKICDVLLQFMRCTFDEKDPKCMMFCEDAAAKLA